MNSSHMKILIVDDEVNYQHVFELILQGEDYLTKTAGSAEEAIEILKKDHFDLVLTDLVMPGMDGIGLLDFIKEHFAGIEVIIVTGYGTIRNAVEAMKKGAYTYFIKSHDPEELLHELNNLSKLVILKRDNEILREQNQKSHFKFKTKNEAFRKTIDIAEKAAKSNANVLLLGESGVGKEVFAKHIHNCSERSSRHFIPINCQAIPEHLIETELFGHEKGSFTGADTMRKGKFEVADGSTLFLDEIGEMLQSFQIKLLRILESRTIERIGSNKSINVDFRLVSATNRDIKDDIAKGLFREDLFYRISTITIVIPPLRERKEDLPDLIDYFIGEIRGEQKKAVTTIDESVWDFFLSYDYPGNVRELKNIIERLVVLSEDGRISADLLPFLQQKPRRDDFRSLQEIRRETEKQYIMQIIGRCNGNLSRSAEKLKISRRHLFNKIREYNLSVEQQG